MFYESLMGLLESPCLRPAAADAYRLVEKLDYAIYFLKRLAIRARFHDSYKLKAPSWAKRLTWENTLRGPSYTAIGLPNLDVLFRG